MALRTTIGAAELYALSDGEHALNTAWHYPDVPGERWAEYPVPPGAHAGKLNFGCFLVRAGGRTVLIDTGWGPSAAPPGGLDAPAGLLAELASIGVAVEDIDTVVFTHLHPDHIGWNLDYSSGEPTPRFSNARYLMPRLDWEHYSGRDEIHPSIPRQALALRGCDALELYDGQAQVCPVLHGLPTPGHTPGHTSFVLESGGESCFVLGDLAHHPAALHETGWVQRFDWDPAQARRTREHTLDRLEAAGTLVAAGHLPIPNVGYLVRDGGVRTFRPLQPV
jgi:YD repeat-containing protein